MLHPLDDVPVGPNVGSWVMNIFRPAFTAFCSTLRLASKLEQIPPTGESGPPILKVSR